MGDDSTDISSAEQSMWFVRSCSGGKIPVKYIGNSTLEKQNAEGIKGVKELVDTNLQMNFDDFMNKAVASTTDGASVMLGKVSGVAVQLQILQPCMLIIHCMAHRLKLAYGDACKKVTLNDKTIKTMAIGLSYFYRQSLLNRENLRRAVYALMKIRLYNT